MIHLKDDFKEGDSVLNIKPSWLNQVAAFINYLHGRGCIINKPSNPSETNAPFIEVAESAGGGAELSDSTPIADTATASAGVEASASRADHAHPLQVDNSNLPLVDSEFGAKGVASLYARSDHQHRLNVGSTAPGGPVSGGAAGSSSVYARADHKHPPQYVPLPFLEIPANYGPTPYSDIIDGDWGTSSTGARYDHRHNLNVDAGKPADVGTVASTGTASTYARRDHVHKGGSGSVGDTTPKVDITNGKAGTATSASREDHQHPLNVDSTNPIAIGTAASAGTSGIYAQRDHVHLDRVPIGNSTLGGTVDLRSPAEGEFATNNTGWDPVAISKGTAITVLTRVRYSEADATPAILCYSRELVIDKFGRVCAVSSEGRYTVATPVDLVLS